MTEDAEARRSIEILWEYMELAVAVQSTEALMKLREELAEEPGTPEHRLELLDGHLAWRKLKPEVVAISARLTP